MNRLARESYHGVKPRESTDGTSSTWKSMSVTDFKNIRCTAVHKRFAGQ